MHKATLKPCSKGYTGEKLCPTTHDGMLEAYCRSPHRPLLNSCYGAHTAEYRTLKDRELQLVAEGYGRSPSMMPTLASWLSSLPLVFVGDPTSIPALGRTCPCRRIGVLGADRPVRTLPPYPWYTASWRFASVRSGPNGRKNRPLGLFR